MSDRSSDIDTDQILRVSEVMAELHASDKCSVYNDILIRKRFKMVRRLVPTEEFATNYFWKGSSGSYKSWLKRTEVQQILSYSDSISDINISETSFLQVGGDAETARLIQSKEIMQLAKSHYAHPRLELLDIQIGKELYQRIGLTMISGLPVWCELIAGFVAKHQADLKENAYQYLFTKYLEMFSINCRPGDFIKLGIPYKDGERISCLPDLLLSVGYQSLFNFGVVQVKRMAVDPAFKHAFTEAPSQGILRGTAEGPCPAKKKRLSAEDTEEDSIKPAGRRVLFEGQEDSSETRSNDSEVESDKDGTEMEIIGERLPESLSSLVRTFFCQLFGSVLALEFHQLSENKEICQQRLAIGVVGFRVIFITFTAQGSLAFKDIPEQLNSKTLVHMTRPLSILDAGDRKEINKMALQMAAHPFL